MTPSPSALEIQIAERFVTTIVLVDDQAEYDHPRADELLRVPSAGGQNSGKDQDVEPPPIIEGHPEPSGDLAEPEDWHPEAHDLSATEISEAFAQAGMVCTILRPPLSTTDTDFGQAMAPLATV